MSPTASGPAVSDPRVSDHLRPASDDADLDPGVYRVVGASEDALTLLRVGDAGARRVNTGELATVDRADLDGFERADNPDGNRPASETVAGVLDSLVWQLRAFASGLRANPLAAVVAIALVVVGHQGHRVLSVPDTWLTAVYFLGVFGVVYLGARGG
ncbi:hypothetical protein BRD06_12245 [Halobacteriales archaeon QS_9_67_15]|nr:MAG: hypothetical protein BRD06_12245 [Halobacteriales archaeon QS_9_67_15]